MEQTQLIQILFSMILKLLFMQLVYSYYPLSFPRPEVNNEILSNIVKGCGLV